MASQGQNTLIIHEANPKCILLKFTAGTLGTQRRPEFPTFHKLTNKFFTQIYSDLTKFTLPQSNLLGESSGGGGIATVVAVPAVPAAPAAATADAIISRPISSTLLPAIPARQR